ncbi:MAG: hypothetical protein WDN49_07175 [Acetobacteraceae bacterium]
MVGDVKATIAALLPKLQVKQERAHLDGSLADYRKAREGLDDLATGKAGHKPIHPQYLAKVISEKASDDAVFTVDVGTSVVWAARYLKMNGRRRLIGSFSHGRWQMPCRRLSAHRPPSRKASDQPVGRWRIRHDDGRLSYLVQQKLPVKVVVFNNSVLGFGCDGNEGGGLPRYGDLSHEPEFRGNGPRHRRLCNAGRRPGGTRGGDGRHIRP